MAGAARSSAKEVKTLDQQVDRVGKTSGRVRRQLAGLFAGVSGVVVLRDATKVIAGFQQTMATLSAVTGVDRMTAQFKELEKVARDMGATTRFSAREAGEGLVFLARAGFSAEESMAALPATLNLAAAGALELGQAADYASNILSQFNLAAEQTSRVADVLVTVANSSNTSVTQLADALVYAGAVAGAVNQSLESTASAIGVLGDSGIQASMAGTQLRGIIAALLGPSSMAEKAISDMNLSVEDLNPAVHSLEAIMQQLADANMTAAQAVTIFGRRNAAGAIVLSRSVDKMKELTEKTEDASGASEEAATIMSDNLAGAFRALRSAVEETYLSIGDAGMTGALRGLVDVSTAALRILTGMSTATEEASIAAQALAVALEAITTAALAYISLKAGAYLFKVAKGMLAVEVATTVAITKTNVLTGSLIYLNVQATASQRAFMLLRTALINHPVLIIAGVVAAAAAAFGVLSRSVASGEREIERLRKSAKGLIDATVELSEIEAMKKLALETKDAEKLAETYRRELELIETQLIKTKAAIERGEEFTPVVNIRGLVPAETLELIEQEMRRHLEGLKTHADKLGEEAAENFQKKFFETTDITEAIVTSTGGVIMKKIGEELSLAGVDAAHAARMLALAMENLNDKATTQKQKLKDVIDELRGFSDETSKAREALESYYTKLRDQTEVLRAGSELEKKQIKAKQDLREELEQLDPIERAYHTFKMNMMIRLNHVLSEQKDKTEDASDAVEAWVDRLKKEKEQADDTAASLRRMAEERIAGLEANYLQRGLSDKDRFLDDMHLMMEEAGFGMDYIGTELGRFEEMWDAIDLAEKFRDLGRDMGTSFGDAIYGMIDDTMSLKEAAQSVAQDISRAFYDAFVTRFLEDMMADFMANMVGGEGVRSAMQINAATTSASILTTAGTVLAASMVTGAMQAAAILSASGGGGLGTLVAKGGVFSHGSITPFARGGIFREPTVFSMPHGLGVAGEAGDEAAVPLKRMKSGNLGVETDGGGGGRYNFVININGVTDANSFRRSRTQIQNDLRDAVRRSRV